MSWDASRYHGPEARLWETMPRDLLAYYSPENEPAPNFRREAVNLRAGRFAEKLDPRLAAKAA